MNSDEGELKQLQKKICEKYNSPCFFCSENEFVGVAIESIKNQPLYGVRHRRENDTCGWYLWGGEYSDDDEFFQPVHFSHIHEIIPNYALKYLALAPGFKFITDNNGYEDVWYEG